MPTTKVTHSVLESQITRLRQPNVDLDNVNSLVTAITNILAVEATKDLPLASVENLQSPVASFNGKTVTSKVGLCPILRAGSAMIPAFRSLLTGMNIPTFHLGLYRDKTSLQPVEYYSKLPRSRNVDTVFILDPVIATGGTASAAIAMVLDWGITIDKIKLISIIGSEQGVKKVAEEYPDLDIIIASDDEQLSNDGFVLPGVGDIGDRLFSEMGV